MRHKKVVQGVNKTSEKCGLGLRVEVVATVSACEKVNVDESKWQGEKIIKSLVGKNVTDVSFKRKDQVVHCKILGSRLVS